MQESPLRMRVRIHIFAAMLGLGLPGTALPESTHPARGIPVLVYHRFDARAAGPTTVKTATLEAQLAWLGEHGYRVVPLRSVVAMVRGEQAPAPGTVAITVDDGHRSVYTELFPLVRRYRIPVTLFLYPSAISRASYALTWEQLQEMEQTGLVDVESHTWWHPDFRHEKGRLSASEYRAFVHTQLIRAKETLERRLGERVDLLAWPFGISDPQLEDAAAEAGYVAAFAYEGGAAHVGGDRFAIPRVPVSNEHQGRRWGELLARIEGRVGP